MTDERRIADIDRRLSRIEHTVGSLRCDVQEARIDKLRADVLPDVYKELGKLQVYQIVTWAILMLMLSGLVGVAWRLLSMPVVP